MTIQFWQDMSILDGSIELAGHGKDVMVNGTCTALDITPLSTTGWIEVAAGLKTGTVDLTLMQDMADDSVDEVMWDQFGVADVPKSIVTASADGSLAYLMKGINLSYVPLQGSVGEIAGAHVSGMASGSPLVRGLLVHPSNVTRSSSSTGTPRQIGAVSATQRLYAALHVLSVAGTDTPTLTVKVQSDNDVGFASAADQITFTDVTDVSATATRRQWSSVAGAVTDDWWRISYTISGTTPGFVFAVTAGIF